MSDLATLPGRLLYARTLRGLGSRELAGAAGLSPAAVSSIERDAAGDGVRVGTVRELARVLDVSPAWLAFGVGAPPRAENRPGEGGKGD